MQRLDFEKQFARQLKDREFKPSADSWQKLQGKLEVEDKKGPQYWWIGIAASIVGAILIFNFVQTDPGPDAVPVIVNNDPGKIETQIKEEEASEIQIVLENEKEPGKAENHSQYTLVTPSSSNKAGAIADANSGMVQDPEVAENKEDRTLPGTADNNAALASVEMAGETEISDSEIDAILKEALSEVSEEDPGMLEVTEEQINTLLAEARAEVRKEKLLHHTASVSAENLLLEVETELEHSFREQVFELIKDGLRKTRTAVANRNN